MGYFNPLGVSTQTTGFTGSGKVDPRWKPPSAPKAPAVNQGSGGWGGPWVSVDASPAGPTVGPSSSFAAPPTPAEPPMPQAGTGGGGGAPQPEEAAAPSMAALQAVAQGTQEGFGGLGTPIDGNLGQRMVPPSSRALQMIVQRRGRIY